LRSKTPLFGEQELRQLGRAVRDAREKAGLSQAQVADKAGLSIRPLRELEAGRSSPSLATIVAIVDALSITLDGLIAAARVRQSRYGLLPAREVRRGDNELVASIEQPRLKVRIVDVDASDHVNVPGGATLAHVLGGSITATLDEEQVKLRRGDSLHSGPGVLTDLAAADGHAQVLLVEALST
jgi:transcriptional regulator with XRE-family HTH domain